MLKVVFSIFGTFIIRFFYVAETDLDFINLCFCFRAGIAGVCVLHTRKIILL